MRFFTGTRAAVAGLLLTGLVLACSGFGEIPPGMVRVTFAVA